MTDSWWWGSDPQEQPIPLVPGGQTSGQPDRHEREPSAIAEEAECIVMASQAAIAREDTDPTVVLLPHSAGSEMASLLAWGAKPADRLALTLLAVGCLAMFSIGWLHRSPATGGSQASARDDPRMHVVVGFTSLYGDLGFHDAGSGSREVREG